MRVVAAVVDAHHVLRFAAHAVFGTEEARRPHPGGDQPIDDVDQIAGDAGRMAQHAHAPPAQQIEAIGADDVEPGCYPHATILRR